MILNPPLLQRRRWQLPTDTGLTMDVKRFILFERQRGLQEPRNAFGVGRMPFIPFTMRAHIQYLQILFLAQSDEGSWLR